MFLVGLTGGIASGKSTVSNRLRELGCAIIDADEVARQVVEPGKKAWKKIKTHFGSEMFHDNGELNREKLGRVIFSDSEKRKLLNSITHPEIYKSMMWSLFIFFIKGYPFVILELPLLFETAKMLPYMSFIIVVSCTEDQQLIRLMNRNALTETEARNRISSQMSLREKCRRATHVIDNSGTERITNTQIELIHQLMKNSWKPWRLRCMILAGLGVFYYAIKYLHRQIIYA